MRGMLLGETEPTLLEAAPISNLFRDVCTSYRDPALMHFVLECFPEAKFQLTAPNGAWIVPKHLMSRPHSRTCGPAIESAEDGSVLREWVDYCSCWAILKSRGVLTAIDPLADLWSESLVVRER